MTTTAHSTDPQPEPVRPPTDVQPRADAAPSTIGFQTPAGRPLRMDLELASRLLSSSRWLQ